MKNNSSAEEAAHVETLDMTEVAWVRRAVDDLIAALRAGRITMGDQIALAVNIVEDTEKRVLLEVTLTNGVKKRIRLRVAHVS